MKTSVRLCHYVAQLSYYKYFAQTCSENQYTHFISRNVPDMLSLWDNVEICHFQSIHRCHWSDNKINSEIVFIY